MKIYSVKDTKLGFTTVFTAPNNAVAIRMFADTCNQKDTLIAQHPADFELFGLGEFDQDTGTIKPEVQFLERATAFIYTNE